MGHTVESMENNGDVDLWGKTKFFEERSMQSHGRGDITRFHLLLYKVDLKACS